MKGCLPAALGVVLQSTLVVTIGGLASPEHMRFERSLAVDSRSGGVACVSLDAAVLAHTASPAHSDLRLFRSGSGGEIEVPYLLTESGPEPVAATEATVEHAIVRGNTLTFDLRMPPRAYSEVQLQLHLQNFMATAVVEGRGPAGRHAALGSVPVLDLSAQGLGRWTALLLAESTWPVLHVMLTVRTPGGQPARGLLAEMVQGATVPPSRSRQTVYVLVAETRRIEQRGSLSVATLRVPAHVPVERIAFALKPGFGANFRREVTVSARADGAPETDTEATDAGSIVHLRLPSGDPGLVPVNLREDAVDATLGATLVRAATVVVAVSNGEERPLPLAAVALEMRERKLCFAAEPGAGYVLRYGDPGLGEPAYGGPGLEVPAQPVEARLGPEQVNPRYVSRRETRPFFGRHPQLFWVLALFCAGMMGGTALQYARSRRAG